MHERVGTPGLIDGWGGRSWKDGCESMVWWLPLVLALNGPKNSAANIYSLITVHGLYRG